MQSALSLWLAGILPQKLFGEEFLAIVILDREVEWLKLFSGHSNKESCFSGESPEELDVLGSRLEVKLLIGWLRKRYWVPDRDVPGGAGRYGAYRSGPAPDTLSFRSNFRRTDIAPETKNFGYVFGQKHDIFRSVYTWVPGTWCGDLYMSGERRRSRAEIKIWKQIPTPQRPKVQKQIHPKGKLVVKRVTWSGSDTNWLGNRDAIDTAEAGTEVSTMSGG
ncbi:hypothetical protein B0H19DRAFT_1069262 [Mycena capillaripes]|nr:hypothetical protein B0H19DRAFT_1069262 [Mycena capillaripes]